MSENDVGGASSQLSSLECHLRRIQATAPLLPVAVGLVTGILLDHLYTPHRFMYIAPFTLLGVLSIMRSIRRRIGWILIFSASSCWGGLFHLDTVRVIPPTSIERFTGHERKIARVVGTVACAPRILAPPSNPFAPWTYGTHRTLFLLDVESMETLRGDVSLSGRVRVSVAEVLLDLHENERVEVFGWLTPLQPPGNPGSFDWAAYNRRQGVVAGFFCKHRENVRRLRTQPPIRSDVVTWLRTTLRGMLTGDLATGHEKESSLLEAMILGQRSRLDRQLNNLFIRAGCVHFLAVSGIHVVIVMFLARLMCMPLMVRPRTRTWVMMAAILLFVVAAEPRPPILRAGIIAMLYCIARLLGRERACLNWISASAIVLIFINPATVFNVGFQLSFVAVLGVSYLTSAIVGPTIQTGASWPRGIERRAIPNSELKRLKGPQKQSGRLPYPIAEIVQKLLRYIPTAMAVAVSAWLVTLPIVAVYFQRVYPWGAPNSLLVLPLATVVMGLGFSKLLMVAIVPALGSLLTNWLTAVNSFFIRFVDVLGHLPGSTLTVPPPPWWFIVPYYAFLLSLLWRFPRPHRWLPLLDSTDRGEPVGLPRWKGVACAATLALLMTATILWQWPISTPRRLVATVLSVGAGSATVIELPDGKTILYDAGSLTPYDIARSVVVPFLRHRGLTRIDRIYLSHPNLDHFSSLPTLFDEMETGPVVVNRYFEALSGPASPSRHLLDLIAQRGGTVRTLEAWKKQWQWGGVLFERLWPPDDLDQNFLANDTSTVLRLCFAGHCILLTGDIEDRAQRALLHGTDLHADVLILPHHGSVRKSTRAFIETVDPRVLVRSSAQRMNDTYSSLPILARGKRLLNTADVGAVKISIEIESTPSDGSRETSHLSVLGYRHPP